MEKNLRYEPYFSLKFWEKIFLILKTKLDWIVIIIQNLKKQEENIIVVRAFFEHTVWKRFWPHQPLATIQRGKLNKNFLHFRHFKISSKYGKKWRKSLFNFSLTHYYSTKEQRKTQIQVILALFFSLSCYVWFHEKSQMAKKNNNS